MCAGPSHPVCHPTLQTNSERLGQEQESVCPWLSVTHRYPRGLRWSAVTFARPSEPQTTAELPVFPEAYVVEKVAEKGHLLRPPRCLYGHRQVQSHGERGLWQVGGTFGPSMSRIAECGEITSPDGAFA